MGGLEVVDPRYRTLWQRARAVLDGDPRVTHVELAGSVGAGTADAWSDLDVAVFVAPQLVDEFLADVDRWLAAITPTVFARTPLAPFIVNACTTDGLSFDVAVYADGAPTAKRPPGYVVGMLSRSLFESPAQAVDYAVAEQLRGLAGPFVSLLQREDHVRHMSGLGHITFLLVAVLLVESGAAPAGKILRRSLTPEQEALFDDMPPLRPTRDSLIDTSLWMAGQTIERSRPLFERFGLPWPVEQERVTKRRLREVLDIEVAWLRD